MKEFDEDTAVKLMNEALEADRRDVDAATEVLDLIFDYYEENGDLDLSMADDDDDDDAELIADYVVKALAKSPAAIEYSREEIMAMVQAELNYEEELLK
ncbi:MAG: hypothetical protein K2L84_08500 [Muribaculaceae bacterium]|nr:hypothetical protein [Muribaculaceae bacterium]